MIESHTHTQDYPTFFIVDIFAVYWPLSDGDVIIGKLVIQQEKRFPMFLFQMFRVLCQEVI